MKIYFAGSIRGEHEDTIVYRQLIDYLKRFGDVLTEHVGDPEIDDALSDRYIHDRDMKWLRNADVVVAEVTAVSAGVGFEIGSAVAMGKRVLCLHRHQSGRKLSAMIAGCPGIDLVHFEDLSGIMQVISDYLLKPSSGKNV